MHVALINNVSVISVLRRWFFVALTGWCQPTSCNSWRNWGATPHKPYPVTIQGPQGSHVKHHQGAKNLNEWRGFRNQQPAACKPCFSHLKKSGFVGSKAQSNGPSHGSVLQSLNSPGKNGRFLMLSTISRFFRMHMVLMSLCKVCIKWVWYFV